MANCSSGSCDCKLVGGDGVSVTGSGTSANPYVISNDAPGLSESFQVNDTPSVNLTLRGSGVPSDPFVLQADSSIKLTQLSDVSDPQGGPAVGDVPVWVGVGSAGHWEFQPPPANPAGSVNTGIGITGTGAAGAPIKVKVVSETLGATTGLAVYVDTAGNLRATAPAATAVDWSTITNKPTTFPPSAHTHAAADINDPLNLSVGNSVRANGIKLSSSAVVGAAGPTTGNTVGDLFFRKA